MKKEEGKRNFYVAPELKALSLESDKMFVNASPSKYSNEYIETSEETDNYWSDDE